MQELEMPIYLLIFVVIVIVALTYWVSATITRKRLSKEFADWKHLTSTRNYVLDVSTETAFVRASFDPPVPINLASEEQIRLAFRNMVNVDWNAAFALQFGYPADFDMSSVSLGDRTSLSDPCNQTFARAFVKNNYIAIGHEINGTKVSGEPITLVASTSGVVEDGYLTGLWGTMIDKTALKNAESELRGSRELLSRTLQLTPDAVVISKRDDGEVIDVNDGFCALTGFSRTEVLEKSTVALGLWQNVSRRQELLAKILETGRLRDEAITFTTKSGQTINCLLSSDWVIVGAQNCVLSVIHDATGRTH